MVDTYLAECIKYWIEVYQYLPFGYLGDVVQAFCGEVAHPVLRIREAYEQRFDELLHVWGNVHAESDSSAGQPNQSAVPYV